VNSQSSNNFEEKSNWIGHTLRRSDDSIAKQVLQWVHKATEEEDDRETLGKEIWRRKCGLQASGSAGGRWRRQHNTERGGDKWSVACDTPRVTRHESSKSRLFIQLPVFNHTCYSVCNKFLAVLVSDTVNPPTKLQFLINLI